VNTAQPSKLDRRLLLACLFASGFTGLVYEVLWTRWFGLVFGTMAVSVSAVLAAFFLGIAVGSYLIACRLPAVRRPFLFYATLEGAIALFGAASYFVIRALPAAEAGFVGLPLAGLTAFRFALALLVLLVPTAAMGATLPVMLAGLARSREEAGRTTAIVYGVNTLGAVAGAYAASFWLLLHLGSMRTLAVTVLLNVAVAAFVAVRYHGVRIEGAADGEIAVPASDAAPATLPLLFAALSGLISIGLEVVITRLLTIVLEGTIYAFGAVLAVFLAGIGAGSILIGRRLPRLRDDPASGYRVYGLLMLAVFFFLAIPLLLLPWGNLALIRLHEWVGGGMALMHVKLLACTLVLLPTALAFGAAFPLVVVLYRRSALATGQGLGKLYAVNTVGAVVGSAAVGLLLIPTLGSDATLLMLLALLAVMVVLAGAAARDRRVALGALVAFAAFAMAWPGARVPELMRTHLATDMASFRAAREAARTRTLYFAEGSSGTVAIYGDPRRSWSMWINGLTQAGRQAAPPYYQPESLMLAVAPYALHPEPRTAAVIGYGGGVTTDALLQCAGIEDIRVIEIEPRVIEAVEAMPWPEGPPHLDSRVEVVLADARNHLRRDETRYDLILAHLSDPWLSGSASLATREFFRLARSRLEPGGILGVWMGKWGWGEAHARSVAAALSQEFEDVMLLSSATSYLLASDRPILLDIERIGERLREPGLAPMLRPHGMDRASALLASIAGAGRANPTEIPPNTDDNSYVEVMLPLLRHTAHVPIRELEPPLLTEPLLTARRFTSNGRPRSTTDDLEREMAVPASQTVGVEVAPVERQDPARP
jgi:spermidine synthase